MIALSGSSSVLARHIAPVLRNSRQVCAFDADQGDIQDIAFLRSFIDEVRPAVFVNCAEFSNVEQCEYYRERAYNENAFAVGQLARVCAERGVLLVHFSTSFVFDGEHGNPYNEDDTPNPLQVYGDSKLLAENLIRESGCSYLMLRVPHVYGSGNSFVHHYLRTLRDNGSLPVIRGFMVSPVYADDVAMCLDVLLKHNSEGLFHYGGAGSVDMATFVAEAHALYYHATGSALQGVITEIDYDDYISPVEYPRYTVLDSGKISDHVGREPRIWSDALKDFMGSQFHEV